VVLPPLVSTNTLTTIQYRRCGGVLRQVARIPDTHSYWPLRALFFRAWQSPTKTFGDGVCLWKITSSLENAPCDGTIFNSGSECFFLYIVLCPSLFFEWIFFRWIRHFIRTIYVTVFK